MQAASRLRPANVPLDVAYIRDKRDVLRFPPSPILQNGDPPFSRNSAARFTTKSAKRTKEGIRGKMLRRSLAGPTGAGGAAASIERATDGYGEPSPPGKGGFPVDILGEMDAEHSPRRQEGRAERKAPQPADLWIDSDPWPRMKIRQPPRKLMWIAPGSLSAKTTRRITSAGEVARHVGVSEDYLRHVFIRHGGPGLNRLILRRGKVFVSPARRGRFLIWSPPGVCPRISSNKLSTRREIAG